ncbi:MAG: MATE family efflux transporter [Dorea sp.]|jgi:putative MATE family efflux protein|nr:MATE family efflux transporter [Erysipelotrichaceae bacterium]MCI9075858.1 MATE family efflux transporter [Dorea sp.]
MNKTKDMDLGKEPIGKLFFMLAVPAIASQVVNALYNIVDRMYIGHISEVGSIALTGVGVCFPIIMIVSAFAALVSMGGAPRASIMMGKGKHEEAEKILGNCFQALIITSLILTVVILTCKTPLLMLFGASDNTLPYAESYMLIYAIGTVFVQLTLGMNAFISAQGFSRISMLTVVIGAVTNIMLDPILIFLFDLGVQGAALATVLSQAVSAVWVIRFLIGKQTIIRLRRKCFKIEKAVLLPAMALGIAPFIMQSTESLLILCFNSSLLQYGGDVAVGTMTILSSVMQFAMMPLIGFTQGSQPIISYNYGAGNIQRIRQGFRLLLISCLTYATLLWFLVMLFPQLFAAVFTSDPELMEMTIWGLRVYMFGSLLMGAQLACQQTFIALGNAKTSAFLAMFRKLIVLIPLIYILPSFFENKVLAVFLAEPIADILAVITTVTLFAIEFKKLMQRPNAKTDIHTV